MESSLGFSEGEFGRILSRNIHSFPVLFSVISAPEFQYLYLSDPMKNLFRSIAGLDPDGIIGMCPWDLLPKWKDSLLPGCNEVYQQRKTRQLNDVRLEQNGKNTYWNVTLIPNFDDGEEITSISIMLIESTSRRRITRERERLSTILEATPDFVVTTDLAGHILYLNRAARELFGIPENADMTNKTLSYCHPDWAYRMSFEGIPAAVECGLWQGDSTICSANGGEIPVSQVIVAHRAADGSIDYISMIARDISERKLAEKRHEELEAHKLDFYRRTILAATEGKLMITEKEKIDALAGESQVLWQVKSPKDLSPIRHAIKDYAYLKGMDETRGHEFVLACGEALTNALKHAGGGVASIHNLDDGLLFKIADRGVGIEALNLPDVALTQGYSTAGTLGMGYKVMLSFANNVYLATGPFGTTIALMMKCS